MISPFKAVLGGDYKAVEKRLLAAIHIRFGLPPVLSCRDRPRRSRPPTAARPISKRPMLAGFSEAEARRLFGRDPGLPESVRDGLSDALERGQGREAIPGADSTRLQA